MNTVRKQNESSKEDTDQPTKLNSIFDVDLDSEQQTTIDQQRNIFDDMSEWKTNEGSFQETTMEVDKFKKTNRCRSTFVRPVIVNKPMAGDLLYGAALPTGSIDRISIGERKICISATNTCCLDTLLMTCLSMYKDSELFRAEVQNLQNDLNDSGHFANCISSMAAGKSMEELTKARSEFLFKAHKFKTRSMSQPLRKVNEHGDKYTAYLWTRTKYLWPRHTCCHYASCIALVLAVRHCAKIDLF